jgi:SAM-dependent methyltransferase
MTVLEPGPAMGFFTLELARLAGPAGRVVAVDVQPRMVEALRRRAVKAGLADRIDARVAAAPDRLGIPDLDGRVDFAVALLMVHETPDQAAFFSEMHRALRPGARLLVAEPKLHVKRESFAASIAAARAAGFEGDEAADAWRFPGCRAVLLTRS